MQTQVVEQIFDELDKIRGELFQTVEMLPSGVFEPRFDKKWNAPKILGHLNKFEKQVTEYFQNYILSTAKRVNPAWQPRHLSENWRNSMNNDSEKYESPEIFRSQGIPKSRFEEVFKAARQALKSVVFKKIDKDFNEIIIPHPNGSKLNLIQWLELLGDHEKRHIRQLENLSF